jgi:predicted MFS family arabinose efflux permease
LAIAVKQSGMPAASMLSGLAVPLIALTLGWRWAFVCAAVVAAVSAHTVRMAIPDGVESMGAHRRLVSPVRTLLLAGVASAFLAFGAGALNAWVVESGVDAGLSKGVAGLGLSLGAGLGILMRVGWGLRLDRLRVKPFRIAGWMALIGSLGALALSVRSTPSHVIATLLAFGTGWIWPIFTNFGIVRANAGSAGSATGITQAGVYLGVFAAPLTSGAIIEASGYPVMWLVTAVSMACGALILIVLAERF